MNQFFSFKRFSLLIAKHWAENRRRYGLSILAIVGLLITWFVFLMLADTGQLMGEDVQLITFFLFLFTIGSFYASQFFRHLGSREKGSAFLLVPASAFEKLLCSLVYVVLLFTLVFVGIFYLVDMLLLAIANALPQSEGIPDAEVANVFSVNLFQIETTYNINLLLFFFAVQSAFLLGSVYFRKFSFVKTVIAGFVGCFLIFLLMYFFNESVFPDGELILGPMTAYRVHIDGIKDHVVQVPSWVSYAMLAGLYAIAPFGWLVTYYRLKEKQV